jgi:hypothetical protein
MEERGDDLDVVLVRGGDERVVADEDVALADVVAEPGQDLLDHSGHGPNRDHVIRPDHRDVAVGV